MERNLVTKILGVTLARGGSKGIVNKNIIKLNQKELNMLSTNFCYGGEEIYEIKNFKN